jgi:DNA-binding winged helix-turn-helix (wHTH) protein
MVYAFNNIVVDTQTYRLLVDGEEASVEPQVFSLLVYLIQNKGKVVTRNELLTHVWKGRIVSDISINNNIKSARKVLGDDGSKQQVIKTIYPRGYQFIAKTISDTSSESAIAVDSILKDRDSSQAETVAEVNSKVLFKQVIAVLPFTNTKPDVETDYLSFALASQIIGDLSYLEKFNISPAGSISKYANQVIDPIAVGRELAVNYVLSGNYLAENKTIRLNVELIEIDENRLVWRESIQVDYDNTFSLQDMVTQRVAKGLDAGFKCNFIKQQHRDIPNSSLAFEYYLRAISYPQSNDGRKMAVEMLEKLIKLDPEYAPSYARLGFQARLLEHCS